eukprot:1871062-Prymnesium_polylepis.1
MSWAVPATRTAHRGGYPGGVRRGARAGSDGWAKGGSRVIFRTHKASHGGLTRRPSRRGREMELEVGRTGTLSLITVRLRPHHGS